LDAEQQAEIYRKRYGRNRPVGTDAVAVPKRLLLPSVDDSSIWGVRCKPGKEREVVFGITKRIEERLGTKNPVNIISAFERGGTMAGYIYIESSKQADVLTALDGLQNVYPRNNMILIGIKERPDLLRTRASKALEIGAYVRIKRAGKYQGDLAQIEDVESNGLDVTVRLVPRLDYGLNEDANAPADVGGAKRKRFGFGVNQPRPPQKLFSDAEAKKKHAKYLQVTPGLGKKNFSYLGDDYQNGFLIKDFKLQQLITENVDPKLEEVTKFASGAEDGTENLDLNSLAASLKQSTANASYAPGDVVEVYEGEQKGIWGKTVQVHRDIVTLRVTEGDLRGQTVETPIKSLRKKFSKGDHVKVIGGSKFRDQVGMVVSIHSDKVTFVSDSDYKEITVFSKDLREASDSGGIGSLGQYDLHDLLQLDQSTVAIIIKVDRESLQVVDQDGSTRSVLPSQISGKISARRAAVATDKNGSEIRVGDTVREAAGEHKSGAILHLHRAFAFLHNREQTENSGVFVSRTSNLVTTAARGGRITNGASNMPDLNKMNPARSNAVPGANGMEPPAIPKTFGRDRALGQTVIIRKGPYKGLLGIVKDTTDLDARVELHTKRSTITVKKDVLSFKE
jgi:transcription elongation factor SPT5